MAHILLIDDDALLRYTVCQMLELDGHRVSEAIDGESGLHCFADGAGIDLVITDVLMPGIDGARLTSELRKRHPRMPIIAISGGRRVLSAEFTLGTAMLVGASCQLSKPFSRQELQAAIQQVTAGKTP